MAPPTVEQIVEKHRFLAQSESASKAAVDSAEQAVEAAVRVREGIVFDRWPFRLDISYEFQCWLLIIVTGVCMTLCSMPCICGTFKNPV